MWQKRHRTSPLLRCCTFRSPFQKREKEHNLCATYIATADSFDKSEVKLVPGAGVEPARYRYRGILSPLRLPISPSGQRGRHHSGCPGNVKRRQSVRSRYTSANGRRWRSPQMPCPSFRIPQATIMLISAPRGRPRIFFTRALSSPSSGQVS